MTTIAQARENALIAGAVHRGDAWPVGTLVRHAGANSKVTYWVTGVRAFGQRWENPDPEWNVKLTPIIGGPGRSEFWTQIQYLRRVDEHGRCPVWHGTRRCTLDVADHSGGMHVHRATRWAVAWSRF